MERTLRNSRRTGWHFYIRRLHNTSAHLEVSDYIRNELELETMMKKLNKVAIDIYEASCPEQVENLPRCRNAPTMYSNAFRKAKQTSFNKFCEGITQTTEALRL